MAALLAIRYSLFTFFLLCVPLAATAQTPQEVQRITEQAIRRLDLQTALPTGPEKSQFTVSLPPEVLWLVIIVAIGVLIYAFRDLLPLRWLRQGGEWGDDDIAPESDAARTPAAVLRAADELAGEGRYVEAMHVLLLQGLANIRRGLDEQFADSLTSREILRSTGLSEAGRRSLRDIIARVERSYFGEHPAAPADYAACRTSFDELARAIHGGALASRAPA